MGRFKIWLLAIGLSILVMAWPTALLIRHLDRRQRTAVVNTEHEHFARHQAAYEHRCPFEKVELIGRNHDWTRVMLNVCGQWYKYRRLENSVTWVDEIKLYELRLRESRRKRR